MKLMIQKLHYNYIKMILLYVEILYKKFLKP